MFASQDSDQGFWSSLKFDFPASIAVFLVALPLCMGIAIASGVPVAAGLMTGIVGGIVAGALSGAPLQVSGPAAGLTVIVYEIVSTHGIASLGVIVLGAGVLQIVAGTLRLGQWFRAVSPAVIHGMMAGIGVLILAGQFHVMVDDKPKESGIRNLVTIPQAIAKGLPLPAASTDEQRQYRTELLKDVGMLHSQQIAVRNSLAAQTARAGRSDADSAPLSPEFAERQDSITAHLKQLSERLRDNDESLPNGAELVDALNAAIGQSQTAADDLRTDKLEGGSLQASVAGLEAVLVQLKDHRWAAKVGIITICALLLQQGFAPRRLKVVPAPLVGVAVGAVAACWWNLPVLYVEVPDDLLSVVSLPHLGVFQSGHIAAFIEAIVVMALIASAETLLCATAVDKMHRGPATNYDRELMAQGVGNSICGLVGALPMTGVIVRSAANVQAGAGTRKSAILHGVWLLVAVCFLTPVLRMIPVAGLAGVLVYTGYKLVNLRHLAELRKHGWSEVGIYLATLTTIIASDLLTGVLVGIGLSAAKLLFTFSHLHVEIRPEMHANRVLLALTGAATFLRLPKLAATLQRVPANSELHVNFEQLHYIDHACLELLTDWAKQHEATGGTLVVDWDSLHAQFHDDAPLVRKRSVA